MKVYPGADPDFGEHCSVCHVEFGDFRLNIRHHPDGDALYLEGVDGHVTVEAAPSPVVGAALIVRVK